MAESSQATKPTHPQSGRPAATDRRWIAIGFGTLGCIVVAMLVAANPLNRDLPVWSFRVINTFPHDQAAFTQGLAIADGNLFEVTGQYGTSTLRRV